jgi:uncharacterized membrane protein (DUF2068 family)
LLGAVLVALVWRLGDGLLNSALGSQAGLSADLIQTLTSALWIAMGASLLVAILYLIIAVGLWYVKNWARIAVILMTGLQLALGLYQAVRTFLSLQQSGGLSNLSSLSLATIGGTIVGLGIQMIILFWFVANRQVFD